MNNLKLLSLFSGIGAFEKALDNLGVEYELVNYCEIDKYASKSYAAIHNVSEDKNLGDITKVNEKELPKNIDLITYGFPCQDISLAGKQKGLFNEDGTQTRSGLFFEALRIIEEAQPRVAIAENVKNLVGKKFKEQFKIVLDSLEQAGYNNYWQVLNAKDYGIPQNRERVFIVSIRKDIDNGCFKFPEGFELKLRLKDMVDDEVDEKYYIDNSRVEKILNSNFQQERTRIQEGDICSTLLARDYKDPKCIPVEPIRLGGLFDTEQTKHQTGAIWDKDNISPTLDTMQGGYRQPCVIVKEATKKGYAEAVEGDTINFEQPNSKTRRGRVGKQVAQTLTTIPQQGVVVGEGGIKNE
jgi:DNA (cytosine-5)-methyltransferase 1